MSLHYIRLIDRKQKCPVRALLGHLPQNRKLSGHLKVVCQSLYLHTRTVHSRGTPWPRHGHWAFAWSSSWESNSFPSLPHSHGNREATFRVLVAIYSSSCCFISYFSLRLSKPSSSSSTLKESSEFSELYLKISQLFYSPPQPPIHRRPGQPRLGSSEMKTQGFNAHLKCWVPRHPSARSCARRCLGGHQAHHRQMLLFLQR